MERAIIYTRVSTDEQNNGYSPSDQKEKLYRFCQNNNIEVVGFYHDDESGKSFDRPEWKKIMVYLKSNKNSVDSIYFLKWDRFSRNAPEAYSELTKLKKLGVDAKAMEQPLDLEIPEQKLMLAIYLTAPEVDNDRRALNIFNGIRRAKKEGRWLGGCPIGYKNKRNEFNKPIIAPEGGEKEKLVKLAFKEFSTGLYSPEDLRKKMNLKGLKISKNAFARMLQNRVYIGEILVPAFKKEREEWVKGQHIGIIEDDIFYACQEIIDGKKKKIPQTFKVLRDEFPLRGFLICSLCESKLTASSSKGRRGGYYPYYHCSKGCPARHKASEVNGAFEQLLGDFQFKSKRLELLGKIVEDKLSERDKSSKSDSETILKEIDKYQNRISNAKYLLLDGGISSEEYKDMKIDIENSIKELRRKQSNIQTIIDNAKEKVNNSIKIISNLKNIYQHCDVAAKQRIISSIFPANLYYEKKSVRTLEVNKVATLVFNTGKGFGKMKKEKHTNFGVLTRGVESEGFEPSSKRRVFKLSTCLFLG